MVLFNFKKVIRVGGVFLVMLLLVSVVSFFCRMSAGKAYFTYSLTEKLQLINFLSLSKSSDVSLSDTVYLDKIIANNNLGNPYAYRLYAFSLMTRSDLNSFGQIKTNNDIVCIDQTTASFLYPEIIFANTNCDQEKILKVLTHFQQYVVPLRAHITEPEGTQYWKGRDLVTPEVSLWTMFVDPLPPDQFGVPPLVGSPQEDKELSELLNLQKQRSDWQMIQIKYWANPAGTVPLWFDIVSNVSTGDSEQVKLRNKTLISIAGYSAYIEAWKIKYHFWTPRPFLRSDKIKTAVPTPNFPGYPSGHATISGAVSELLLRCGIRPEAAADFDRLAKESADSRAWAGIHFPSDNSNGLRIGKKIGDELADRYCK